MYRSLTLSSTPTAPAMIASSRRTFLFDPANSARPGVDHLTHVALQTAGGLNQLAIVICRVLRWLSFINGLLRLDAIDQFLVRLVASLAAHLDHHRFALASFNMASLSMAALRRGGLKLSTQRFCSALSLAVVHQGCHGLGQGGAQAGGDLRQLDGVGCLPLPGSGLPR